MMGNIYVRGMMGNMCVRDDDEDIEIYICM